MSNSVATQSFPLCVDMDETLIHTDVLIVGITQLLHAKPWLFVWFIFRFIIRRAAAKAWLAKNFPPDPAILPYRYELLDYLKHQKATGRKIYLVSAADQRIVDSVASHIGLFDAAYGSDGNINLKGKVKAAFIMHKISSTFVYAGDSFADLHVWQHANGAIICGKALMFEKTLSIPIEAKFK